MEQCPLGKSTAAFLTTPGAGGGAESALSSRETKFGEKKLNNAIIICDFAIDGNVLHPWVWEREAEMGWDRDGMGRG